MEDHVKVLTEIGFTDIPNKLARQATNGGIEDMLEWLTTPQKPPNKTPHEPTLRSYQSVRDLSSSGMSRRGQRLMSGMAALSSPATTTKELRNDRSSGSNGTSLQHSKPPSPKKLFTLTSPSQSHTSPSSPPSRTPFEFSKCHQQTAVSDFS
jgi:hypothetical protein